MKIIKVRRGASKAQYKTTEGDVYTDTCEVIDSKTAGVVYFTDYCNSDPTVGYKGGRIANGIYYAIVGIHKGKYPAFKIFNPVPEDRLKKIRSENDLTEADRTLPSDIPNPNHDGKCIIQCVNIHKGGAGWDWSHGCITILLDNYDRFMTHFEMNEIAIVEVM